MVNNQIQNFEAMLYRVRCNVFHFDVVTSSCGIPMCFNPQKKSLSCVETTKTPVLGRIVRCLAHSGGTLQMSVKLQKVSVRDQGKCLVLLPDIACYVVPMY